MDNYLKLISTQIRWKIINKFEGVLRALPKRSDREVVNEHRKYTVTPNCEIGLYIPCQLFIFFHDENSLGVEVFVRLFQYRHKIKKHAGKIYVILKRHKQYEDQIFHSKTNEAMPSNLVLN